MNDKVSDALTRIKNGYLVSKPEVTIRYSKLVWNLCKLLEQEGYLSGCEQKEREIFVTLRYNNRVPAVTDLKRVSRPSLRIYKGSKELPRVLNGLGIALVSTPKGVMTDRDARKQNIGGEVLALVW